MIKGLHHNAYRCRDSEVTRAFYEDFLGLPLADAFEITTTRSGRSTRILHSFYRLGDGSFMALFEAPDQLAEAAVAASQSATFAIEDMTCALCPVTVRKAMEGVSGVKSVSVDFEKKNATVAFDSAVTDTAPIAAASTNAGYPAAAVGS